MFKVKNKKLNREGFFLYWGIISHLSLYTVAISVWPLSIVPTALTNVKRLIDCILIYSSTNQGTKTFQNYWCNSCDKNIWNNLSGSSTGNSGWPCPSCTLVNPPTTKVCSACNTNKDGMSVRQNSSSSSVPAANPARTMQRQRSIPVESRRKRDEKQAKEQWIDIVKYCKIVSITVQTHYYRQFTLSLGKENLYIFSKFNWLHNCFNL